MLSIRPKDETSEEKLKRKKALKEFRQVFVTFDCLIPKYITINMCFTLLHYFQERRMERKANTLAFKEQKKKLEKEIINKNVNKTVRVI